MERSKEVRAAGAIEAFACAVDAARDALGWAWFGGDLEEAAGEALSDGVDELMVRSLLLAEDARLLAPPMWD